MINAFCGVRISIFASVIAFSVFASATIATICPIVGSGGGVLNKPGTATRTPPIEIRPVVIPTNVWNLDSAGLNVERRCQRAIKPPDGPAVPVSLGGGVLIFCPFVVRWDHSAYEAHGGDPLQARQMPSPTT